MKSEAERSISCVIIVCNGADLLASTVASLARQSLPPAEIVVVEAGGCDSGVVRAVDAGRGLVRLVRRDPAGPDDAHAIGAASANGEYLHFAEAGDLVPQGSFAALYAALQADPACDAVFGRWRSAQREGEQTDPVPGCGLLRRRLVERDGPVVPPRDGWTSIDMVTLDRA